MKQHYPRRLVVPCLILLMSLAIPRVAAAGQKLGALGRLQPEEPVLTVVGPPGPAVVATIHVALNDQVKQGDPLVTLSNHDSAANDVELAKAQLARIRTQVANSVAIQELDVRRQENTLAQATRIREQVASNNSYRLNVAKLKLNQARAQVDLAKANQKATARRAPLLIQEQELQVRESEQRLALAKVRLHSYEQVGGENIAPREMELRQYQVEQAKLGLEVAQAGLKRATSEAEISQERAAGDVRDAEARADIAQAEFEQLEATGPMDIANAEQDIANAQVLLDAAKARLTQVKTDGKAAVADAEQAVEQAEKLLATTIVHAPFAGTILELLTGVGEAAGGRPLVRLADLTKIVAVSEVYEGDLLKVKQGMSATISSGALPEDVAGEVIAVSRQIDGRLRVGRVLVRLSSAEAASRLLNHEVTVKIQL